MPRKRGPWTGIGELIIGAKCPNCKQSVVYNGNYFCGNDCGWAMDQNDPEHRPPEDREILRLAGVDTWGTDLPEFSDREGG